MTVSSSTSDTAPRARLRLIAAPGRAAGLVALVLALAAQLAGGDGWLAGLRLAGFDALQRLAPRRAAGTPALIVAIDDASLKRFGQWPWPRNLVAELVARIHADHPRVLGIDILWPEPDRLSPARWATLVRTLPPGLAARLTELRDHDVSLGEAIAAAPTVVAVAGLREGSGMTGALTPVLSHGGDPRAASPAHAVLLRSVPEIDRGAAGHGLVSVDKDTDGEVRRLPMLAAVGTTLVPSLTLEMLRLATGAERVDAFVDGGAMVGLAVGPLALPTEPDGTIRLALAPSDPRRFISAADLLDRRVPAGTLQDRLVLLGVTGLGLVDRVTTALGPMVGVELHAQLLETVTEGRLAARPRWAAAAEAGALAVLGLALIGFLPGRRLGWYGPVAAALPIGFGGVALGAWAMRLWLLDAVLPSLGSLAVLVALIGGGLAEADAQRRQLRRELDAERLQAARVAGELEAARRIQMGILPRPEALAGDPRFDLDAVLEPAKEIGGDLYDFFLVDRRHLFVAVGDVTGKGVPASLFMALGKALYKSCVLRGNLDPAAIMAAANQEISRDNPEMMFITLFAGLLDLDSGRLAYCNAGHEPPYAMVPGEPPRPIDGSGGPPLCVVEDFAYAAHTFQLRPGELVCLATDGVTEAMDRAGALLGHGAVRACLAALPPGADAAAALAALRATVARFVAGAEPSDDLTALVVRWTGATAP
jgi:serine phosphatase RsbU (regulator of sigma subunit)